MNSRLISVTASGISPRSSGGCSVDGFARIDPPTPEQGLEAPPGRAAEWLSLWGTRTRRPNGCLGVVLTFDRA